MTLNKTVERLPGRCPHCGGTFIIDEGVNKCLACSRTIEGIGGMKRYYIANQPELLANIAALGRYKTRLKWKIPSGTFTGLLRRWSNNGTPEPLPAAGEEPEGKSLDQKLVEAYAEIQLLRGYQQACRELMQGKK